MTQRPGFLQVAGGYRRPLPDFIPEPLRQLISECWAQDAKDRPAITDVMDRLTAYRNAQQTLRNGKSAVVKEKTLEACCTVM